MCLNLRLFLELQVSVVLICLSMITFTDVISMSFAKLRVLSMFRRHRVLSKASSQVVGWYYAYLLVTYHFHGFCVTDIDQKGVLTTKQGLYI